MLTFAVLIGLAMYLSYQSIRLPGIALVGLFCMFVIEQWAQSQSVFFVERSVVINVLFALITGFALSMRIMRRDLRKEPYPLGCWLVIVLFLYALLSTNWTDDAIDVQTIWTAWAPYIVVQILIAPLLVADPKQLTKIFAYQIFFGGLFAALIISSAEFVGRKILLGGDSSLVGNPLAIAEASGITIICAVMMTRMFRGDVFVKLLICGICLFAIIKSGSRGQLIALAFALIVAFPITYSVKNPKIVVGSALVVLLLGYATLVGLDLFWADSDRFSGDTMARDYQGRLGKITRLMTAWLADPGAIVFGLGNSSSFSTSINGSYPHFVPIEILCELGIVGALMYLWLLAIVIRESIFVAFRYKGERNETAGLAILVGVVVYMFMISLKQGSLIGSSTFFMSVMIFVRSVAYVRQSLQAKAAEDPTPKEPLVSSFTPRPASLHPRGG